MASVLVALASLSSSCFIHKVDDPSIPSNLHDIVLIGQQLYRKGHYSDAYRLLVRVEPLLPPVESGPCVEYQIKALRRLGHIHRALELSQTMAVTHPSTRWCYLACDLVLEKEGDVLKAREWLKQGSILRDIMDDDDDASYLEERLLWEKIARIEHKERRQHGHVDKRMDFTQSLSYDLVTAIFQHLSFRDRVVCMRVSRHWHNFLVDSVVLWQDIDVSHTPTPIDLHSFSLYLGRLENTQPKRLRIHHERANGDQLMKLMLIRERYKLHTLDLSDVLCKPSLFYDLLRRAGPTLRCLRWNGLILKLNDIFDTAADSCPHLEELDVSYCFTSRKGRFEPSRFLESYGKDLPKELMDDKKQQRPLYIKRLRLTSIHEMIGPELIHMLLRTPHLTHLELEYCLVSFIPIANMLQHCCPRLQHLVYKRHRYARQYQDVIPHSQPSIPMPPRRWRVIELNKSLSVTDTIMRDMIIRADLSLLERLELDSNTYITDKSLFVILQRLHHDTASSSSSSTLSNLHTLNLGHCTALTEQGLLRFLVACPMLRHVNLTRLSAVTDAVLDTLSQMEKLQTLDITFCSHVTDQGIIQLVKQRQDSLQQIHLTHSNVSPAALSFVFRTLKYDGI